MTQNTSRVSKLLLQYQIAGQQNVLKANAAVTVSLKEAEEAAKQYGTTVERLQELGNLRIAAEPLQGNALSGLKELERAQEAAAAASKDRLGTEQKTTAEQQKQVSLLERYKAVQAEQRQRLIDSAAPTDDALAGRRTRSVTGTLTGVREGLIALPNVGYQNPAVVALRGLIPLAERSGASFTQLGAALGIAGVAVAGVAVAMKAFNDQMAESKRRLEGALQAQQSYYSALTTLTTEQAQERITELQRARDAQRQQLDETRNALQTGFQQAQSVLGGNVTFVGDAVARLLDNQTGAAQLRERAEQLQVQFTATNDEITRLTQGLDAGAFAANTLREAEAKLAEERQKVVDQTITDLVSGLNEERSMRLRLTELRRGGTSEQVEARQQAVDDEVALLQNYLIPQAEIAATVSEVGAQALQDYKTQLQNLLQEQRLLIAQVLPIIQAREAEAAAVRSQLDALQDSVQRQQELAEAVRTATVEQVADRLHGIEEERKALQSVLPQLEALAPTSQDAADQLAAARARLSDLNTDYVSFITRVLPAAQKRAQDALNADLSELRAANLVKLNQINEDLQEKQREALAKRDADYLAAEEKRSEASSKLAEDLAKRREQIERKSNASIANAIYARDALAAYLAMQQKREQLQDLKDDGDARRKEIDRQFAKERQQADANYRKAFQQAQDAANKSIRLEQQRLAAETQQKIAAYNAQIALLNTFNVQGVQAISDFVNNGIAWLRQLSSGLSGGTTAGGATGSSGAGGTALFPPNPYIGQYVQVGGQGWVWNGRSWQPATAVRQFAQGGVAQGLARINDGAGVESGLYERNKLMVFSQPTRIFSAEDTRQMLYSRAGGAGGGVTVNINLDGKTIRATSRQQALNAIGEYLDNAGVG